MVEHVSVLPAGAVRPLRLAFRPRGRRHQDRGGTGLDTRELRHSFVSIMSDNGVRLEAIADLVGHKNATVTAGSTGISSGRWSPRVPRPWTPSSVSRRTPSPH